MEFLVLTLSKIAYIGYNLENEVVITKMVNYDKRKERSTSKICVDCKWFECAETHNNEFTNS